MNYNHLRFIFISLCLVFVFSTSTALGAPPDENEAEHEKLRAMKVVFEEAVNKNQMNLLKPYLHKDFSVVTLTKREFNDFDTFYNKWQETREEMLKGGSYSVTLNPDRSQIFGDVAVAKGTSDNLMITGKGTEYRFVENWTAVCLKVDDNWKIVRIHSSIDPFNNPIIVTEFKKMMTKITVIAHLIAAEILI